MKEIPSCCFASLDVRTRQKIQSAHWAWVVQILEPFRTYSSPSRTALICSDARSEPEPGSE